MKNLFEIPRGTVRVDAFTDVKPFFGIDLNGNSIKLGETGFIDYEKAGAVRAMFYQNEATQKQYRLGIASQGYKMVDHREVVQPLLDFGLRPSLLQYSRGGSRLFGIFSDVKTPIADLFPWAHDHDPSKPMYFGIGIISDAKTGRAYTFTGGLFRVVCTNGLVSSLLNFGSLKVNHRNWRPESLVDFLGVFDLKRHENHLVMSSYPKQAFEWLSRLVEEPEFVDSEPKLTQSAYRTIQNSVSSADLELWAHCVTQADVNEFSMLDMLNIYTGLAKMSTSSVRIYDKLSRVIRSTNILAEAWTWKGGQIPDQMLYRLN